MVPVAVRTAAGAAPEPVAHSSPDRAATEASSTSSTTVAAEAVVGEGAAAAVVAVDNRDTPVIRTAVAIRVRAVLRTNRMHPIRTRIREDALVYVCVCVRAVK